MWEWKIYNNTYIIITIGLLFLGFVWAYNIVLGIIITVMALVAYHYFRYYFTKRARQFLWYSYRVKKSIEKSTDIALNDLEIAIIIIDKLGRFDWINRRFSELVEKKPKVGDFLKDYWPGLIVENLWQENNKIIQKDHRWFKIKTKVFMANINSHAQLLIFINDITDKINMKQNYENIMPVFLAIQIDNLPDVLQGLNENQSSILIAEITNKLNLWIHNVDGYLKKYSSDSYIGIVNRSALAKLQENRFSILDEVRDIKRQNRISATLSIGGAVAEKLALELSNQAFSGLDLALGRGGDQVVFYVDGKVNFYGGKAQPIEKNTRVKVRVMAAALKKIMLTANKIYIVGHKNEDFDIIGAALGIFHMAKVIDKQAYLILENKSANNIKFTVDLLKTYEQYTSFIITDVNNENITEKDLLIILDTHKPTLLANKVIADLFSKIVVIDHHRRSENFINNVLLIYLEPSTSSVSEIVTELLYYFEDNLLEKITSIDATMLLAGIMLDTKNFNIQTGIRTFEAAAALRRAGADMFLIRKLFASNLDEFRIKSRIASSVEYISEGVVLATCPENLNNSKIIAAQIVDSFLEIQQVISAFVVYIDNGIMNISARSNGEMNVQIIMERMGGGGHHAVAGTQLEGMEMEDIRNKLIELIKEYDEVK